MVDNGNMGYFKNLKSLQVTGHKLNSFDGTEMNTEEVNQMTNTNFMELNLLIFSNNGFKDVDSFEYRLSHVCDSVERKVTIRARQETILTPHMCSNSPTDDVSTSTELTQCHFTWNWEYSGYRHMNTGPYPNEDTVDC